MADRLARPAAEPAEIEIEITPEMIEAGVRVLCGYETETAGETYWAKKVFIAMWRASNLAALKSPQK